MNRILSLLLFLTTACSALAQRLESSLTVSSTKARITVRAAGGNVTGNSSNFVFSVAIPIANASATLTVTNLDASRLPTSLTTVATYTDAAFKYFNLTYTGTNATAVSWTQGTSYDLVELTFSGSTNAPISLISLPDGNPSAPAVPGNWFTYLEIGGIQYSDPAALFFQSIFTDLPTQAVDYSTGTAIVTTNTNLSLPVSMVSFAGRKVGMDNSLTWKVAGEYNNAGFQVLRSFDGLNYVEIGFVPSKVAGNTTESVDYGFDDRRPGKGRIYYKLNQVDLDRKSKFSNIVTLTDATVGGFSISRLYPNPSTDHLNLVVETARSEKATVILTDLTGKIFMKKAINFGNGVTTVQLETRKLSSGSYIIRLVGEFGAELSRSEHFIKI